MFSTLVEARVVRIRSCFCASIWTDVADPLLSCALTPVCVVVLTRSPAPVVAEVLLAERPVCVLVGFVVSAPVVLGSVLPGSVLLASVLLASVFLVSVLLGSDLPVAAERPVCVARASGLLALFGCAAVGILLLARAFSRLRLLCAFVIGALVGRRSLVVGATLALCPLVVSCALMALRLVRRAHRIGLGRVLALRRLRRAAMLCHSVLGWRRRFCRTCRRGTFLRQTGRGFVLRRLRACTCNADEKRGGRA